MKIIFLPIALILSFFAIKASGQPILTYTPVISSGLSSPIQLVHAGDGTNRIFIVQKGGTILVFDRNYNNLGIFLTVTGITSSGERGLLSMAFHPDYPNNGLFFVYYTNGNGDLEVARYNVSNDPNVANAASKVIVITVPHPVNSNHNGGTLHFGNDGYLYLSTGDGGGGGDVPNNAQNTGVLLGKLLRFDVNTSLTAPYYSIPADNPYGNEIYCLGLRNPFRWSFDRLTHDLWIGDVGQDSYEEIDFRPHDSTLNVNFGWHCYEGNATYTTSGCTLPVSAYTFPVFTYPTPSPSGAITGGTVYRGNTYISLRGYYIATDFYFGILYLVKYDSLTHTAVTTQQSPTPLVKNIANFGESENGELYAVSLNSNTVYRVISDGPLGYTFIGNGDWNVASNWSNNTIPPSTLPAGAEIIIDPFPAGECRLNIVQTISAGAKITVMPNKAFLIPGDLIIQ